jgi:hypothetical protein
MRGVTWHCPAPGLTTEQRIDNALQHTLIRGRLTTRDGAPALGVTVEAVPTSRFPTARSLTPPIPPPRTRRDTTSSAASSRAITTSAPRSSTPPALANPCPRLFYRGTESAGRAVILRLSDRPEPIRFDMALPNPERPRTIEGVVLWPDGKPAPGTRSIWGTHAPWQAFTRIADTTDETGLFTAVAVR